MTREKGVKGWGKVIDFVPSEQPGYENCAAATTTSTTSTTTSTTSTTTSTTTTEATTAARTDVCTFDSLPANENDFVEGTIWNCEKSNDDLTNGSKCFKSCRTPDVNMQGTRNTVECKCNNAGCSWKGGTASCVQQFCNFENLFWPNGVTCQLPDGTEVPKSGELPMGSTCSQKCAQNWIYGTRWGGFNEATCKCTQVSSTRHACNWDRKNINT